MLYDYPQERERWFEFKADRVRQRMLRWLALEGIEPVANPTEQDSSIGIGFLALLLSLLWHPLP